MILCRSQIGRGFPIGCPIVQTLPENEPAPLVMASGRYTTQMSPQTRQADLFARTNRPNLTGTTGKCATNELGNK